MSEREEPTGSSITPSLSKGKQPRKQSKPSQGQLHPTAEQEQPRLLCWYPQQGRTGEPEVLLPARLHQQTPLHPGAGSTQWGCIGIMSLGQETDRQDGMPS